MLAPYEHVFFTFKLSHVTEVFMVLQCCFFLMVQMETWIQGVIQPW